MIKIKIDPKQILDACKDEQENAKKELTKAVKGLANATKVHITELSKEKLSPSLQLLFKGEKESNLRIDHLDENVSVITLSGSAYWIEEGIPPNTDMKTDKWLFKSKNTKQGKNGRYLIVPFEHSKAPRLQSAVENRLSDRIKFELNANNRKRKENGLPPISWSGIERNKDGTPKEGLIHKFDFTSGEYNKKWSHDPLHQLRIYQAIEKDEKDRVKLNNKGKVKVTRSFMTFRTASESTVPGKNGVAPKDKFIHPGFEAKKFMDASAEWAENEFYTKIIPAIIAKWKD